MVIFTMIHGVRLLSEVSCERSDEQQAGARSGEGGAPSGEVMDDEEATVDEQANKDMVEFASTLKHLKFKKPPELWLQRKR